MDCLHSRYNGLGEMIGLVRLVVNMMLMAVRSVYWKFYTYFLLLKIAVKAALKYGYSKIDMLCQVECTMERAVLLYVGWRSYTCFLLERTAVMLALWYDYWGFCSCWHCCSSAETPGLGMIGLKMADDYRVVMVGVKYTADCS